MSIPTHGSRRDYTAGCRCVVCRAANAAYASSHRFPIGTIPAIEARGYLLQLAALGLGIAQIAKLTGIAPKHLRNTRNGRVQTLRASTSATILATRPTLAPGALVKATKSWRFVDSLEREGYTRRELAYHLGSQSQQLQFGRKRLRQSTADRLSHLYIQLAEA